MGCICSKGINKDDIVVEAISIKRESTKSLSRVATPSKKEEAPVPDLEANPTVNAAHVRSALARSVSKARDYVGAPREGEKKAVPVFDSTRVTNGHHRSVTVDVRANKDDSSSRRGKRENGVEQGSAIVDVPNGVSGEHVIAGWPTWLTMVAAEAVKGWLPRRADSFEKLDKVSFDVLLV